ncbi:hypothetical protein RHGRI_022365 [Rhododendron griersonianum]|uniref:Uncharacterized protein n=1 Tax=Rhododendron griersonianum TaxID=479676 RepID=A0AAV6J3T0_9ERIC|nr:hypothetical protein RHGRI_022365 [Rhododendron griersonianum]
MPASHPQSQAGHQIRSCSHNLFHLLLVSPSPISLTFPSSPPNPHHLPPSSPPLLTPVSPLSMGPFLVNPDRGLMLGGLCPLRRIKTPEADGGGYGAWFLYRGSGLKAISVSLGNSVV